MFTSFRLPNLIRAYHGINSNAASLDVFDARKDLIDSRPVDYILSINISMISVPPVKRKDCVTSIVGCDIRCTKEGRKGGGEVRERIGRLEGGECEGISEGDEFVKEERKKKRYLWHTYPWNFPFPLST
jgi:hypothetical protein